MKKCTRCGETKPFSEYMRRLGSPDGYRGQCRVCRKSKQDAWVAANPARKKATDARLYVANMSRRKAAMAGYYVTNKVQLKAAMKKWRSDNSDRASERKRERRKTNGDAIRAKRRSHYAANKSRYIANARRRDADKLRATPSWADLEKIAEFYALSEHLTLETGIKHHVDHIIPLRGKNVCGLHVHTNLQVITAAENLKKSNYFQLAA